MIKLHTDCLVLGAGSAGYGAAMAALRDGCSTVLADRHGFVGGMGTAAGLSSFINYRSGGRDVSESIYRELVADLKMEGAAFSNQRDFVDYLEPEAFKRVAERNVQELGGTILYHCLLISVRRDDDVWQLSFAAKGVNVEISARYVVDTSGDADFCALAGATLHHGRKSDGKTQPMSLVVQLAGFNTRRWKELGGELIDDRYAVGGDCFADEIAEARRKGRWSIPRENIAMWWSMPYDASRITINGTRLIGYDACNPLDVSRAEIEGRRQANELACFFRDYIPGFEQSYLLQTGPHIGVRESRRILGREELTEDDIHRGRVNEGSIVYCAYPIDIHEPDGAKTVFDHSTARLYGISLGCLLPRDLSNVIAAGRCISATHEAAGSFRVMPTCMALGEAAGTAIAIAAKEGIEVEKVSAAEVRSRLDRALRGQNQENLVVAGVRGYTAAESQLTVAISETL